MTRHDFRVLLWIAAIVVGLGLAIGYGVGRLTQPDRAIEGAPPDAGIAFDGIAADVPGGTVPGYGEVYVNDYADLLDAAAEGRIRDHLIELYERTGIEMTVLTIRAMSDYGHDGPIEPFATRLFNTWGIGNAERNDGVLILVARDDRRMRIELGSGYSAAWDGRMQRVIDEAFLPAFRRDAYQEGIERGVEETVFEITGVFPGEWEAGTVQRGWSWIFRRAGDLAGWIWALAAAAVGAAVLAVRRYLRDRPRPCPDCGTIMLRAGEEADDAHLDGGQRLEEYLKSVDYDVWHCPDCAHIAIHGFKSWFGSHGVCPACGYRTLHTTSEVLRHATTESTGLKRLDYHCKHCGHEDSETRTIPKKSESSSGSGRSSFGGGSSSGGGASGSW